MMPTAIHPKEHPCIRNTAEAHPQTKRNSMKKMAANALISKIMSNFASVKSNNRSKLC